MGVPKDNMTHLHLASRGSNPHRESMAPSWIGQADDSGDEFWKITKYITGFAVCLLWCFVYE